MRTVGADDPRAMANRYGALTGERDKIAGVPRADIAALAARSATSRAVTVRYRRVRTLGSFYAQSIQNADNFGGAPEPPLWADLGDALYVAVAVHDAALCSFICW